MAGAAVLALALSGRVRRRATIRPTTAARRAKAEFNAAMTKVFNPSDKKGGTIRLANAGDWDTLDPGETYYGYSWNFLRLYGRSLVMFKPAPGKESNELVPDLAEALGVPTDGGKTWTYKLRKGVKYEDGTRGQVRRTSSTRCCARSTRRPSRTGRPTSSSSSTCRPATRARTSRRA